ncbi:gamma-glutamyltransferase, partial [Mesorhizobium sp. M00.F.Ca.ET.149.01.1.1]
LHTLEDFAATKGDYRTPVSTSYRGHDIHQMPPNNQGLTALLMLNVLSGFDLGRLDPEGAERLHLEIETGRLAYQDRDAFFADQDHVDVPVKALLSGAYADSLRAAIDPERAMTHLPRLDPPRSDTVYISVVDRDR